MISEEEARARILETIAPLSPEKLRLREVSNRFAAEDVFAAIPLPTFDNSAMDGYAVRAADCRPGAQLRVIGEQPAGRDRQLRVGPGDAVRIFTGAPVPVGADAVVMQEDTTRSEEMVSTNEKVEPGEFVRRRGCDLAVGQKIVRKGERLRPALLGLLASQGMAETAVGRRPTISILSTGDELVGPGRPIKPGEIYETNSVLLEALARAAGVDVVQVGHCRDDRAALRAAIERGASSDVLMLSGGVSVGEHDLVQETLRGLGAKIEIWRVAIKPGKPFLFAHLNKGKVFGLPGNPVSGFVTWFRLVRPAVLKMMGAADDELLPRQLPAKLEVDVVNAGDRPHYVRGRLANGAFNPMGRQESHALFGLSRANSLLRVESGAEHKAGAIVPVELLE